MNTTVSQPNGLPTNKLTAGVVASAVVGIAQVVVGHYVQWLAVPEMWAAVYPVAIGVAGWFVKDADNSPAT